MNNITIITPWSAKIGALTLLLTRSEERKNAALGKVSKMAREIKSGKAKNRASDICYRDAVAEIKSLKTVIEKLENKMSSLTNGFGAKRKGFGAKRS